jgi:hypothetical protein
MIGRRNQIMEIDNQSRLKEIEEMSDADWGEGFFSPLSVKWKVKDFSQKKKKTDLLKRMRQNEREKKRKRKERKKKQKNEAKKAQTDHLKRKQKWKMKMK